METIKWEVYIGALLFSAAVVSGDATRCYRCRNGRSNAECNAGLLQTCASWNYRKSLVEETTDGYACEVEVFHVYGRKIIKKRCIEGNQCYNPNVAQCDKGGTRCTYCCFGDLCNKDETSSPTTSTKGDLSTTPRYQTIWITIPVRTSEAPFHTDKPYQDQNGTRGRGIKGDKGDRGLTGLRGEPGEKGSPGSPGEPGSPGVDVRGYKGEPGKPGPKGPKGHSGEMLTTDIKGSKGHSGDPGQSGSSGSKGAKGACSCRDERIEATVSFTVRASAVEQTADYYEHVPVEAVISNITNVGRGISRDYMDFAAPVSGLYVFHVTSIANGNAAVPLVLVRGAADVIVTTGRSDKRATGIYPVGHAHATLWMERGNTVSVVIKEKRSGFFWGLVNIYSASDVAFSGFLLSAEPNRAMVPT